MHTKLVDAYAVAGSNDEKVARMLGVSLGSARLAKKRHCM
jgi:transposase